MVNAQNPQNQPLKLGFGEKIAYAVGALHNWLIIIIGTWLMYLYAPSKEKALIPVSIVGIILTSGRIVDAITDPLIAHFSDKTESRFGRRKIYLIFGVPLMALFFYLLFAPPFPHQHYINIIYLSFVLAFFWTFYTVVFIPYSALLPEIAVTKEERISISPSS